ncbi:MAG: hypothetical protein J3K34DRAFT_495570 [Monoraphidium minutum]|nr:MAG: hypothetical protein J3K34DRAFT_495570 [Monoraphidium minutum]
MVALTEGVRCGGGRARHLNAWCFRCHGEWGVARASSRRCAAQPLRAADEGCAARRPPGVRPSMRGDQESAAAAAASQKKQTVFIPRNILLRSTPVCSRYKDAKKIPVGITVSARSLQRLGVVLSTLTRLSMGPECLPGLRRLLQRATSLVELDLDAGALELAAVLTALGPCPTLTLLRVRPPDFNFAPELRAAVGAFRCTSLRTLEVCTYGPLPVWVLVEICALPSLRMLRANLGGDHAAALVAANPGLRGPIIENFLNRGNNYM